jgi:hypothetical protein
MLEYQKDMMKRKYLKVDGLELEDQKNLVHTVSMLIH